MEEAIAIAIATATAKRWQAEDGAAVGDMHEREADAGLRAFPQDFLEPVELEFCE